jgi:tetratricopeptide (TPR) repeat protein
LVTLTAAWVAANGDKRVERQLSSEEAQREGADLLSRLRRRRDFPLDPLDGVSLQTVRAACQLIDDRGQDASADRIEDARCLYAFINEASWPEPDFEEKAELLADCAFTGWRIARRVSSPGEILEWEALFNAAAALPGPLKYRVEEILATSIADRAERARELFLDDPETLLSLVDGLRKKWEADPRAVLGESKFLYGFLERQDSKYPLSTVLLDEREYFLGETARIAGNVSRALSLRDEAHRWLDFAEGWFRLTENAAGNLSKVAYHRLALRMEEREFAAVSELLPPLITSFERLGMTEDAIKTRFLQATILKETDRLPEAEQTYCDIVRRAEEAKLEPLLAHAYVNLSQIYSFRGDTDQAVQLTQMATPLLRRLGYRMALAKLQWTIGYLLREKGRATSAINAYREAQTEFGEIGMRADVAAVHLVIADLLIDNGQDKQAEWEIRQALPIIDEYKLVPEGFAALTLLRESVRRQKIDRQALRNLHGYFEELSA